MALLLGLLATGLARADVSDVAQAAASPWDWSLEPWLLALLLLAVGGYARGVGRVWAVVGRGHGLRREAVLAFAGGWTALLLALVSPLDTLGGRLLSAHMVQQGLLVAIAAPLLVLGRPLVAWTWAVEPATRQRLVAVSQSRSWRASWRLLTDPVVAWGLYAIALWAWHIPSLFGAALASQGWHLLQQASLLAAALLFWWCALGTHPRAVRGAGIAVVSLFATVVHTAVLGTLLGEATAPWYEPYIATSQALGIDPLQDQHLAGLVLWAPAALSYGVAALALLGRLLVRQRA